MTPEELSQITTLFTTRLDRAVESIAGELSDFRTELNRRFESVDRRAERLSNTLHSMETQLSAINQQLAGMLGGLARQR
jgi:flagellar capping protein FliD